MTYNPVEVTQSKSVSCGVVQLAQTVIGLGTDIIECHRIARMMDKHGDVFIRRVFTASEIEYCSGRKKMAYQHYAARWAAKEAVLKTLSTGWARGISWTDVELVNLPSGKPVIRLYNRASEVAEEMGINEVLISVSHTREYAVAFATAIGWSDENRSPER